MSGGYVDTTTFSLHEATDTIIESGGGFVQATTAVGHDLVAMMVPNLSAWVEDGPIDTLSPSMHLVTQSNWAMEAPDQTIVQAQWVWGDGGVAGVSAGWNLVFKDPDFTGDVVSALGDGSIPTNTYDVDAQENHTTTAKEYSRSGSYWSRFSYVYDSARRYTTYIKMDAQINSVVNWVFDGTWKLTQGITGGVPIDVPLTVSTKYAGWFEFDGVIEADPSFSGDRGWALVFTLNGDRINPDDLVYAYSYTFTIQMFLESYVPAHQSNGETWLSAARVGSDDVSKPMSVIARSNLVNAPKWAGAMDMQPVGADKAIFVYLVGSQSSGVRLDGVALSTTNGLAMGPTRTLFDHSLSSSEWDTAYVTENGRLARLARNQNSAVVTPLNSTDVRVTVVVEEFPAVGSDGVSYLADRDFRIQPDLTITPLTPGWIKYSRQADPFTITTGRGLYSSQLVDGHVWVADMNRSDVVTFSSQIGVISLGTVAYAENVHTVVTSGGIVAWLYNWDAVPAIDIYLIGGGTATRLGRIEQDVATGIAFESSSFKPWLSRARVVNQSIWGGWRQNVNLYTTYYGVLFDPKGLALNYGVPHDGDIRSGVGWVTVQQPDRTALGYSAWSPVGYQLKVSRTIFVGVFTEIPPLRLLQRDDGAGLRGHARLQLQGIARRSNSQQTGVRLGIENTYL